MDLIKKYELNITDDTTILLYVGSEEDRKNVITILESLQLLQKPYIFIKI